MSGRPGQVLVVICDVGPQYGVGHLMRCVALAEEFARRGATVVFAADVASVPFAVLQVESRGFLHVAAPQGVEDHLRVLTELGATAVVIDSYHLPLSLYDAVRAAVPTLALVDGDPGGRSAHLLVDQNIGAESDHWPLPDRSVHVAGLDYALMRTEILDRRPAAPRSDRADPARVFAFFGGTDAFGAGPVLTGALVATGMPFSLRVVAPRPWDEPVVAGPGQSVELIAPTDRLADEVLAADLVVSAAGTSSWELLCLGAACAFVCVADNQALAYGRAIESGLGLGLGVLDALAADSATATTVLREGLADAELRAGLRERGWHKVDGGGRGRVLDAFAAVSG
jgi:spore coat polysaccharide biosynthesis predicted glycosyltransferase SpsG